MRRSRLYCCDHVWIWQELWISSAKWFVWYCMLCVKVFVEDWSEKCYAFLGYVRDLSGLIFDQMWGPDVYCFANVECRYTALLIDSCMWERWLRRPQKLWHELGDECCWWYYRSWGCWKQWEWRLILRKYCTVMKEVNDESKNGPIYVHFYDFCFYMQSKALMTSKNTANVWWWCVNADCNSSWGKAAFVEELICWLESQHIEWCEGCGWLVIL